MHTLPCQQLVLVERLEAACPRSLLVVPGSFRRKNRIGSIFWNAATRGLYGINSKLRQERWAYKPSVVRVADEITLHGIPTTSQMFRSTRLDIPWTRAGRTNERSTQEDTSPPHFVQSIRMTSRPGESAQYRVHRLPWIEQEFGPVHCSR